MVAFLINLCQSYANLVIIKQYFSHDLSVQKLYESAVVTECRLQHLCVVAYFLHLLMTNGFLSMGTLHKTACSSAMWMPMS